MISKKSFFNKAIFLNNLKRFKWGSILYGILLFFSVPFVFLIHSAEYLESRFLPQANSAPPILTDSHIIIPALLAVIVPLIAAVLVFNNVHSVKQSIFAHTLPVSRLENYISDVLSSLVLMVLPVVVNGIILLAMSLGDYGAVLPSGSVIYWVFLNISIMFIMFSVATATAFLTGSAAVHIGLCAFVHVLPMIVALFISVVSEEFLYGFVMSENFISNEIISNTPLVWLFLGAVNYGSLQVNMFACGMFWFYITLSLVLYVAGYLLYRVRKVELSGDVCAFSIFRPIFKYMTTAAISIFVFAILCENNISPVFAYIEIAVSAAITYFICEMLINKTFRVFGAYTGLLVFCAISAAVLLFVGNTSVFGYETYIPEASEIESASVHDGYRYDNILISDATHIENVMATHKSAIGDIGKGEVSRDSGRSFYITYKLRSGEIIRRSYTADKAFFEESMSKMYENMEYKQRATGLYELNIENVSELRLFVDSSGIGWSREICGEEAVALMRAVEKDVELLSYKELSGNAKHLTFRIDISCTAKQNLEKKIFRESDGEIRDDEYYEYATKNFDIVMGEDFKNTFALLKKMGCYDDFVLKASPFVRFLKKPIAYDGTFYSYNGETLQHKDFRIDTTDCVRLDAADGRRAVEEMFSRTRSEEGVGNNYYVFIWSLEDVKDVWMYNDGLAFGEADLPDYIKKYL